MATFPGDDAPGAHHPTVPARPWAGADLVARYPFVGTITVEGEADLEVRDGYREREGKPVKPQFTNFPKKAVTPFRNPEEKLYVGGHLSPRINQEVEALLGASRDVFVWTPRDLKGIPPSIMTHSLSILPNSKPVKQRRRRHAGEKGEAVKVELAKLLKAGFVSPVQYPTWLSNIVMVTKANGKWRMCVDFTSLNKACPQDPFPLPCIDQIVDSVAECDLLCFLDAFSGYHQIKMAVEDVEKTSFISLCGVYCYTCMPFGPWNARATF